MDSCRVACTPALESFATIVVVSSLLGITTVALLRSVGEARAFARPARDA